MPITFSEQDFEESAPFSESDFTEEQAAPIPSMQPMFIPEPIAMKPPASLPRLADWQKAIAGGPPSPRSEEISQFAQTAKSLAEGRGESVSPGMEQISRVLEYGEPTGEQRMMAPPIPIHTFTSEEIKKLYNLLPESMPGKVKDPQQIEEIASRAAAALNTGKGILEFAESPVGRMTFALGGPQSPIVNRITQLLFAADAARRVPEAARAQAEIETTGTPQQKWEGRLGLGTLATIAAGGGKGGIAPRGRITPPGMPEGTMEVPVTTGILREAERNLARGPVTAEEAVALSKPTPRTPEELTIKQAVPKAEPEVPAPKAESAPEPAAPSIREQAEAILTMPSEELKAYKGGATGLAWDVGSKAKTAEDVAVLKEVAEKASAEGKALMKQGKFNEAMALAGRQPAEAYEYATGVKLDGTPKWETLEKLIPDYKPPVPDAKYLEAKGIKPVAEPAKPPDLTKPTTGETVMAETPKEGAKPEPVTEKTFMSGEREKMAKPFTFKTWEEYDKWVSERPDEFILRTLREQAENEAVRIREEMLGERLPLDQDSQRMSRINVASVYREAIKRGLNIPKSGVLDEYIGLKHETPTPTTDIRSIRELRSLRQSSEPISTQEPAAAGGIAKPTPGLPEYPKPTGEQVGLAEPTARTLPPKPPTYVPLGRLNELRSRSDADLIAIKPGKGVTSDYTVKRYSSRKALEAFLKNPGEWSALVKTEVDPNMLVHPAFQKPLRVIAKSTTTEVPSTSIGITTPGGRMVMDAFEKVNRTRQALGAIFRAGSERRLMDQTMDAADNQAHIAGAQARKSLDIGTSSLDRQAAMAIVETNGNRARLADFLRQATGKNDEAVRAVNHAIANWDRLQPLAQRTRNLLDHQLTAENAAGINTEFREAYVPHIYDMDLLMGQGRPYVISGSGKGTATGFKKGRTFDTVFDAIEAGYTPKTLDVGQLVEHRVKVGQRLMNRKAWAEGLKTVNDPSTGTPIVTELERKQRGPGGTWYETAPLGYTPREIIPGVRVAVHEGYASLFDALTGTSRISGSLPGKALLEAGGLVKHGLLLFDTFHVSRILQKELFLTGRVGYKKGLSLLEYSDADLGRAVKEGLITQDMADYARTNRADAQLLIKNGLNVGRIQEALYTSVVRQIKGLGTFNKWVFEKMTRGAMMESGLIELERVQAARPDLTREQAARIVARDLNTYFGNLGRQGLFKSQTAQDMARLVALAPQWVESMARSEAKGAYQLGKGLTYDPLVHKSIMVGSLGKGLGQGLLAYFIGTQLLNLATRHQFTWQNEEQGHKLDAWIPDVTGRGNGFFISPFSVVAELTHDMIRYSHSEGNLLDAAIRIASNKASPLVRAGKILLTGRTFGKEYIKNPWDRAKTAAVSLAPAPIPAQPLIRGQARPGDIQRQLTASLGFKTEAAPSAAEQISDRARGWMKSIGKESETEILQTPDAPYKRLRHAIRMGNDEEAKDAIKDLKKNRKDDEILQAMRHSENAPFTGSLRWEKVFKRSLTPQEMGIYVRAAQERKLDHARFMNLWRRASG